MSLTIRTSGSGKAVGSLCAHGLRTIETSGVKAVWYRKPLFDFKGAASEENRGFAVEETRSAIDSILSLFEGAFWVNDLQSARSARVKAQQLSLASELGMRVPRTLITSSFDDALAFADSCPHGVAAKTIYSATAVIEGIPQAIPTQRITSDDVLLFQNSIKVCPVQLQEYVPKAHELRVTVFGREMFVAKLDSQKDARTTIDWRPDADICPHEIVPPTSYLERFCLEFLQRQGLVYGALDIIVTPEGEYVFLENNPFGQYLWVEDRTDAPLTRAMANLLLAAH